MLWEVVNSLLKKTNNKLDTPELLQNKVLYSGDSDICKIFNEHFVLAGEQVKSTIPS